MRMIRVCGLALALGVLAGCATPAPTPEAMAHVAATQPGADDALGPPRLSLKLVGPEGQLINCYTDGPGVCLQR